MNHTSSEKKVSIEDTFYIVGLGCFAAAFALCFVVRISGVSPTAWLRPCILHTLTGLYCPGCGGTRACISFLSGDLYASFRYHPFVPYAAICCIWFMISQTIEKISRHRIRIGMKYRDIYLWISVVLLVVHFVVVNAALIIWKVDLLNF